MKQFYLLVLVCLFAVEAIYGQCNTSNATDCLCPGGIDTCSLYPDLKITESLLLEAAQNPETLGELRISVSTPNIGYGPLQVLSSNYFVCGTDTIYSPGGMSGFCPDGVTYPSQLIKQRVYRKEGNTMINYERWAGSMTYHPTHGHMHVDAWCIFSIRTPIEGVTNPLQWPIVAEGSKTGFCLMDYGSCNYYNGYCVNDNGQVVTSANQVNYGLGGGEYSCGFDQGISAGFTDIYHHYLEGMGITIPPGVCNGNYYLVVAVDPENHFIETNEDNNIMAVPITLTKQNVQPTNLIAASGATTFCRGESVQLQALAGDTFLWSNGETSSTITATEPGEYWVNVTTNCYSITSQSIMVNVLDADVETLQPDMPTVVCEPTPVTITATAQGTIDWFDLPDATEPIFTGAAFTTPPIAAPATYYAQSTQVFEGNAYFNPPHNNTFGGGGVNAAIYNGYLIFDAYKPFTLQSIKVYATGAGNRTFQVRNADGSVIQEVTVMVPAGESRVTLNLEVPTGSNLQFGTATHPNMHRTNTNVVFPYTTPGLLSIKGSNYDDPANSAYYYYYFYDWEVKEPDFTCTGIRTPVSIGYEFCTDVVPPSAAGNFEVTIAPNPSAGAFTLYLAAAQGADYAVKLYNLTGAVLYSTQVANTGALTQLNITPEHKLPTGIYLLQVNNGYQTKHHKVVVQ